MRIDVRETPGLSGAALVTLDGRDVSNDCLAADDEEGWVDLLALDEHGMPQVLAIAGRPDTEMVLTRREAGRVVITLNERGRSMAGGGR